MIFLTIVLVLAYQLQFRMQESVYFFDNFEKFDCSLYADSIHLHEHPNSGLTTLLYG